MKFTELSDLTGATAEGVLLRFSQGMLRREPDNPLSIRYDEHPVANLRGPEPKDTREERAHLR